jgi:signal transduction histidine kinase
MKPLLAWSIRTRLLLLMLTAVLPAIGIMLYNGHELRQNVVQDAEDYALRQVQAMAAHHERVVDNARLLLRALGRASEVQHMDGPACEVLLGEILKRNPDYASLFLADARGDVVAAAPPRPAFNVSGTRYFEDAVQTGLFATGNFVLQKEPRRVLLHLAQPIVGPAGRIKGVLVAAFDLNYLLRLFIDTRLPENSVFTLSDAYGTRLTRFPKTEQYTWVPDITRIFDRMIGVPDEGTFQEFGVDQVMRLYAFKRLHFEGAPFPYVLLRLGIPVENALAEAETVTARNIVLLFVVGLVAMAAAWAVGEFAIVRRLKTFVAAAERLGAGDLATRSGLSHGEAELGRLALAFDNMAAGLERREEEHRHAEEQIRRLNEELEARVVRRTEQLAAANRELQEAMEGLRRTQSQLVQSEKMAALGGLVAGVAHEINTPVGVGVTAASHLDQKTRDVKAVFERGEIRRSDLQEYLDMAGEAASMILGNLHRASDLIRSFKKVAVDQTTEEKRSFKVREYIDEILLSLRPKLKKTKIRVEIDCDEKLAITGYPGAFSQILANFVLNSLTHAFDEGQAGRIGIAVTVAGGILTLTYSDDGKGMPPEVLRRIFEPFFTTARSKGGSGLGLSIVYNLVTQTLNGTISCVSEPGRGAVFTVTMPVEQGV